MKDRKTINMIIVEIPNEEIDSKKEKDQDIEDIMEVENAKQSEDIKESS